MIVFYQAPSQDTFTQALLACAPYYFTTAALAKGKELFKRLPFNYHATEWWLKKASAINFTAQWIPENVKTLIIGASHDYVTPFSLFEKDKRFHRGNIMLTKITDAGHFPWFEQMTTVKQAFNNFYGAVV